MNWYKLLKLAQNNNAIQPYTDVVGDVGLDQDDPSAQEPVGDGLKERPEMDEATPSLETITPDDIYEKGYMEDDIDEEKVPNIEDYAPVDQKDFPKFSSLFSAFRWAKKNSKTMIIHYRTIKGSFSVRRIEPHGDFWARTTLKRIIVTWDETIGAIRAFRLENVQKYEFLNENFVPKFNFSQLQHNYRKRIKHRKDKRKELKLMNVEIKNIFKLSQIINDPSQVGMNYTDIGHRHLFSFPYEKNDEKMWIWDEDSGLITAIAKDDLTHRQVFPHKALRNMFVGRYENRNGKKKVSISRPYLGGEKTKEIPLNFFLN